MGLIRLYLQDTQNKEYYLLPEFGSVVIGRSPDCELPINNTSISRKHCQLTIHTPRCIIEITDLDSINGLLVNNMQTKHEVLRPTDTFQIGDSKFMLIAVENPPANYKNILPKRISTSKLEKALFDIEQEEKQFIDDDIFKEIENAEAQERMSTDKVKTDKSDFSTDPQIGRMLDIYRIDELTDMTFQWKEFKGTNTLLEEQVIIRIISKEYSETPDFMHRFKRDVQASSKLSHANIINFTSIGKIEERYYLVREYNPTMKIGILISKFGAQNAKISRKIGIQIASALVHAHKNKILHRNINPSNILLHKNGKAYLSDFGFSSLVDAPSKGSTLDHGYAPRTILYRSPELFSSEPKATELSDIYSLCAVLFLIFFGYSLYNNLKEVLKGELPKFDVDLATDEGDLTVIILKGLEQNSDERFQSASELNKALNK